MKQNRFTRLPLVIAGLVLLMLFLLGCPMLPMDKLDDPADPDSENYQGFDVVDDPTLITAYTVDGAMLTEPVFSVSKVVGAQAYWLQVATDENFGDVVFSDDSFFENVIDAQNLQGLWQDHYWRVAIKVQDTWSPWTAAMSFRYLQDRTVYFDSQGGNAPSMANLSVVSGNTYGTLATTVRSGYVFDGWWTEAGGIGKLTTVATLVPTSQGHVLYAKWILSHTVTFASTGGSDVSSLVDVLQGEKIVAPAVPIRTGYVFDGWYKESGCANQWEFGSDMVAVDMTLYAKWIPLHTVAFNSTGGSEVSLLVDVLHGEKIVAPVAPTRTGYVFDGWYKESGCVNQWEFGSDMVVADMTLYAKWIPPHTVTLDSTGGSAVTSIVDIAHGINISAPIAPTRSGYVFDGWYKGSDCVDLWEFGTDLVVADMTLYAKWVSLHTVSFNSTGGSAVSIMAGVVHGTKIVAPVAPTRTGYVFDGWYKGSDCVDLWEFGSDLVVIDMTLYAKWIPPHTVTLDSTGGSAVTSIVDIAHGTNISAPIAPTRSGYVFDGWYKGSDCVDLWEFGTDLVVADMTLYAKWVSLHTVSFNSTGGSAVSIMAGVVHGTKIVAPVAPTRTGYVFDGWYKGSDCVDLWEFGSDLVVIDMTLYAKWHELCVSAIGPAGGIIFYDKGSSSDGWRYLEAAPTDILIGASDYTHIFGYSRTSPTGANMEVGVLETGIGTGKANTAALVDAMGSNAYVSEQSSITTTTEDYAARLCDRFVFGIYYDWFLPSKYELDLMYDNLKVNRLGGFYDDFYWSSSEDSSGCAWVQSFDGGWQGNASKSYIGRVRPVRAF